MLPNHAPLVIAEQFGTLESLYPGRIDLGLGRAPGTDQLTLRALRRSPEAADTFPRDVIELQALLGRSAARAGRSGRAGDGNAKCRCGFSAPACSARSLAAMLGLPFAFASHFAPDALLPALEIYRERFEPSEQLQRPYAMVGCNVIAAETDAEARRLFTSPQQSFANLLRGTRGQLRPPIDDIESLLDARREGAGLADARLFVRRLARDGGAWAERLRRRDRRGRTDRRVGDLRSCGAIAVVRDAGGRAWVG